MIAKVITVDPQKPQDAANVSLKLHGKDGTVGRYRGHAPLCISRKAAKQHGNQDTLQLLQCILHFSLVKRK